MSLAERDTALTEVMDGPCDEERLFRTYRDFTVVNRFVSGWHGIYARRVRPLLAQGARTLLDVGFGGGDIPRALAGWADADGLELEITAIDPDERALHFAQAVDARGAVRYLAATTSELRAAGERFDIVVSNHMLHHLDDAMLAALLDDTAAMASRLALHSDLERNRAAYGLFAVGALPFAARSYVRVDGLRSIRRSFTEAELAARAPGWRVARARPWRLELVRAGAENP